MKVARQSSVRTFDTTVKKDRVINLNVGQKGTVNLVRYYSQDEMKTKMENAREEGRESYVPPCISQSLSRETGEVLMERREDILECLMRVRNGEDLQEEEAMIRLGRSEDCRLFLRIDCDTLTCHVRRYWLDQSDDKLKPTARGITINVDEMMNVLMVYDQVMECLDDLQPEQDGPAQ